MGSPHARRMDGRDDQRGRAESRRSSALCIWKAIGWRLLDDNWQWQHSRRNRYPGRPQCGWDAPCECRLVAWRHQGGCVSLSAYWLAAVRWRSDQPNYVRGNVQCDCAEFGQPDDLDSLPGSCHADQSWAWRGRCSLFYDHRRAAHWNIEIGR